LTAPITWAQATSPILWSNVGIDWDTPAKTGDPTYGLSQGLTVAGGRGFADSITFAVSTGVSDSVVRGLNPSATFAVNSGYTSSSALNATGAAAYAVSNGFTSSAQYNLAGSATFAATAGYTSSSIYAGGVSAEFDLSLSNACELFTNYADSISFAVTASQSVSSGFLWNEVDDVTTTWTKVDYPN